MSRSIKKGPYVDSKLIKKIEKMSKNGKKNVIKTWSRRSMITPDFVGHTFAVHNGNKLVGRLLLLKMFDIYQVFCFLLPY